MGHCDSASCGKSHPGRLESSQPRPPAEVRRGSRKDNVATDTGGGGWFGSGLLGVGPLDRRNSSRTAATFFVGADGVSVQALAQGPAVSANRQTLRNRELGQLGQTQMWLKRYKTGMFANLANLANVISQNSPAGRFVVRDGAQLSQVGAGRTTVPAGCGSTGRLGRLIQTGRQPRGLQSFCSLRLKCLCWGSIN